MVEFTLIAQSPLDAVRQDHAGLTIEEITGRSLVSIATPLGGADALNAAVQSTYGTPLPAIGRFTASADDDAIILGMSQDQHFILFDDPGNDPAEAVSQRLASAAYVVDQSDAWVIIRFSGPNAHAALERICPIDLHPANFGPGRVARTAVEHLAAIILRGGENAYVLLSPRSSAQSFLHALETSARNVA